MTTIPRAYVDNFTRVINGISDDAQKKLAKALEGVVIDDIAAARNEIIAIMDTLLAPYTDNVAAVAATFYDGLRAYFGIDDGFMAESESMREPAATAGAVRAFMQTQVDGKPFETLENLLTERVDYECKRAANECIAYNAKNDPKRPKWARVPTGAETCEWCIMLASRGFAYLSEEAASHTHANCDCRVIPSWDKDNPAVQGYDPELYYDMWKHPEKYKDASNIEQSAEAKELSISADTLYAKGEKEKERAINSTKKAADFNSEALGIKQDPIEVFYDGSKDVKYFMGEQKQARADAIQMAIRNNPKATREEINAAEIKAAREFSTKQIDVPKEISGKSTAAHPRTADMRAYFNKDGNPFNFTQRGGVYSEWKKNWGKEFADKMRKRYGL